MALKFQCKNCGEDIVVRFLKVGEAAECRNCGASNSVPESAESIDDEAAELMIKASISESAESINDGPTKSLPIARALRIIGILSIIFGVIAGIFGAVQVINQHPAPDQAMSLAVSVGVTVLGLTFYFCSLGVICLGIAKVIELLTK
jgi:hypothetical protein